MMIHRSNHVMLMTKKERSIVNKTVRKRIDENLAGNDLLDRQLNFEELFGEFDDEDDEVEEEGGPAEDGDPQQAGDGDCPLHTQVLLANGPPHWQAAVQRCARCEAG